MLRLITRVPRLDKNHWQSLNWFSKWLVMSRAIVLVMTLSAVAVGLLLAARTNQLDVGLCVALIFGLTMAHASNNLINDWVDYRQGTDRDNYFRQRYGTHVLEDKLVSIRYFWCVTTLTGCLAIACGIYVVTQTGMTAFYLTLAGAFFVLFYTWPLKHLALGEVAVLLVWGPLITGGSYFVVTQNISVDVLLISMVSGIGPTIVILAKHIDKYVDDTGRGIVSLPVLIGKTTSQNLTIALLLTHWILIGVLILVNTQWWLVASLLTLPVAVQLLQNLRTNAPVARPKEYPIDVWPLWHTAIAFRYCSYFGLAMIAGLSIDLLL